MTTFTRSGQGANPWCDMAPHASGWMACWSIPGAVQFEDANGNVIIQRVPTDFLRYLDADGNGSEVVAIGVGGDDHAYLVSTVHDGWTDLGLVVGNFAVAVFWDGTAFLPILVTGPSTYTIDGHPRAIPIGNTSQGIRQLLNDVIIWGDETHVRDVAGRTIHKFSHIGPVFAGQRNGPDHIDLFDGIWHTPIEGSAQPPKLTQFHTGAIGVCAATNHGAVFTIGPPWPAFIPDTPIDPPPPRQTMLLPADVHATYAAAVAKFPHTGDDDARRAANRKAVETVRARHGSRWATKTEHANGWASAGKDALVFVPDDPMVEGARARMFIWDMIIGDTRQPKDPHESEPIREAFLLVPEPKDWLSGDTDGPRQHVYDGGEHDTGTCDICGKPKDDPIHIQDQPGDGSVEERLAALEEALSRLKDEHIRMSHELAAVTGKAESALSEVARAHSRIDGLPTGGGAVDAELRTLFYRFVGKLRESKSTSRAFGHSHSIRVFEGDL